MFKENLLHMERMLKRGNVAIRADRGKVVNKRPCIFDFPNEIETSSHDGIKGIWICKEESHA